MNIKHIFVSVTIGIALSSSLLLLANAPQYNSAALIIFGMPASSFLFWILPNSFIYWILPMDGEAVAIVVSIALAWVQCAIIFSAITHKLLYRRSDHSFKR